MVSSSVSFDETALSHYTDAELESFIISSPRITTTREETVRCLSSQLVAKPVEWPVDPQDEALALERAGSVSVRVPVIRRVIRRKNGDHFLIMDRIHGMTLEQSWNSMGLFATVRAAWQLRTYLRAMAFVVSQTTGGLHSGETNSEWLQGYYGPIHHASPSAFCNYLNWWLLECRPSVLPPRPEYTFHPSLYHTLVHQDLAPRNMIMDPRGVLWIIDWGHAGFYPPFMEYGGMEAVGHAMPWLGGGESVGPCFVGSPAGQVAAINGH